MRIFEWRHRTRRTAYPLRALAGVALVVLWSAAGCSAGSDAEPNAPDSTSTSTSTSTSASASASTSAASEPSSSPSGSGSSAATPMSAPLSAPPTPKAAGCYRLSYQQAIAPTSAVRPSTCDLGYTARTYLVGNLDTVLDGHLLAVDSKRAQDQLAATCPKALGGFLGGDAEDLRLSMFRPIWFSPTIEQSDAGQNWFRCDVTAISGPRQLGETKLDLSKVFDSTSWADTFGMCGTANPTDADFQRVWCAAPHSWRAISTVDADGADYPGADALSQAGKDACEDPARDAADDPLDVTWTYEPPTKDQWDGGQHYGICWVPSS